MRGTDISVTFHHPPYEIQVDTKISDDCTYFTIEVFDTYKKEIFTIKTGDFQSLKVLGTALKLASELIRKVKSDKGL